MVSFVLLCFNLIQTRVWKETPTAEKIIYACEQVCGAFSSLMVDLGGLSPLWALPLGKWPLDVWESMLSKLWRTRKYVRGSRGVCLSRRRLGVGGFSSLKRTGYCLGSSYQVVGNVSIILTILMSPTCWYNTSSLSFLGLQELGLTWWWISASASVIGLRIYDNG